MVAKILSVVLFDRVSPKLYTGYPLFIAPRWYLFHPSIVWPADSMAALSVMLSSRRPPYFLVVPVIDCVALCVL